MVFEKDVNCSGTTFRDTKGEGIQFTEANFQGNAYFNDVTFEGKITLHGAVFKHAVFQEETSFEGAKFLNGTILFTHAEFHGKTKFNNAEFVGGTYFDDVTFEKDVDYSSSDFKKREGENTIFFFNNTTFEGETNFYGVSFENNVKFIDVNVKGNISFYTAKFQKGTEFIGATFEGKRTSFDNAEVNGTANFDNANFEEFAYFRNTIFYGNALFNNTTFKKPIYFEYSEVGENKKEQETFQGETEFNYAIFEKEVSFLNITFKKNAAFKWATFKGGVIFQTTRFENNVTFHKAIFEDYVQFSRDTVFGKEIGESEASFEETEFCDLTNFVCSFNVNVTFRSAKFKGDTYFVETIFENELIFDNAKFEQMFNFVPEKIDKLNLKNITTYGHTKIEHLESVRNSADTQIVLGDLTGVKSFGYTEITGNLVNATFNNAYLENVNFVKCEWPENFKLYEEIHKDDRGINLDHEDLETIYRNLKNSFTKYGQGDLAGMAFYREMEMRRLEAIEEGNTVEKWKLCTFKYLCGYGERIKNIFFCSSIIIVGFAVLFLASGIDIKNRRRYNLSILDRIKYFYYCCIFSISSFTTLGSNYITPRNKKSKFFSVSESLIGAFFIALFIYVFARKMLR